MDPECIFLIYFKICTLITQNSDIIKLYTTDNHSSFNWKTHHGIERHEECIFGPVFVYEES